VGSGCFEGLPAEARQALEDAASLRRRLERLVRALALGSEMAAELLRSAAPPYEVGEVGTDQLLRLSRRCEQEAKLYRGFEHQLSRYPR